MDDDPRYQLPVCFGPVLSVTCPAVARIHLITRDSTAYLLIRFGGKFLMFVGT